MASQAKDNKALTAAGEGKANYEYVASFQALQAGYYWRAVKELQDQNGVAIAAGTVLLLKSLKYVDDEVHTVVLQPHPGTKLRDDHRFLVADFLANFEFEPEGRAVREQEMLAIQREIEGLQQEMQRGQNDPAMLIEMAEKEGYQQGGANGPAPTVDTSITALIASGSPEGQLASVQHQMNNQVALATARANYITTMTGKLTQTIQRLAPFFEEQGAAALAQCEDVLATANTILKGVASLELYTGKNVEVNQLCDGEGAPAGTQIFLFQRKLYMDEESLVNVAQGGADYNDLDAFASELSTNPELLNRLVPAPRGVVAMAYRRRMKDYGDPWANVHRNEQNRASFLLIRDGQKVYQVYSQLATHDASRLFPTKNQMEQPFRGVDGGTITVQDVRFSEARERHDSFALHYKRLLILMAGLHDRLQLFGEIPVPGAAPLEFFDAQVQERLFRFVYDDESNLISDGRIGYRAWMKEKNKLLRSGSRVLCVWRDVMTPSSCPSVVESRREYSYGYSFRYQPVNESEIAIAYREKEQLLVKVRVKGATASWRAKNYEREFEARVFLGKCDQQTDFLVLDDVSVEDLDYYILSRENRVDYLNYIVPLSAARDFLKKEREAELPAMQKIKDALVEGGIIESDADVFHEITNVVRKWRAANRGRMLPAPGSPEFDSALPVLLDQLYTILGCGHNRAAAVADLLDAEGRRPLRLVITGKKKLVVYATPLNEELEERLGRHLWVQRIQLQELKTKISTVSRKWVTLPEAQGDETVLHQWEEANEWIVPAQRLRERCDWDTPWSDVPQLTYEQAKAVFEETQNGSALLNWLNKDLAEDMEAFARLFEYLQSQTERLTWPNGKSGRSRSVQTPSVAIPVAVIERAKTEPRKSGFGDTYPGLPAEYSLLVLTGELHRLLYEGGNDEQKAYIEKWIRNLYRYPDRIMDEIRKPLTLKVQLSAKLTMAEMQWYARDYRYGKQLDISCQDLQVPDRSAVEAALGELGQRDRALKIVFWTGEGSVAAPLDAPESNREE